MAKQTKSQAQSRGKQRRAQLREMRATRPDPVATLPPPEQPAFFYGFDVTWVKVALLRVVVFSLLAVDGLLDVAHAARYGAGGFNVAQLPLFDAIGPGRAGYEVGQLLSAYLFILAACGVATRVVLPLATAIYGWLYFGSQLDSYQHHYLVFLVLVLSCFVPWQRPADATPATPVRSWALRMILLQLAILYFWAAVSKMTPAWLDGRTLSKQMAPGMRSLINATVGMTGASWLVIATELTLAATIWNRRLWVLAAPLGLALHVGILKTGLDIGLFAWIMIGLYILVVPDAVWVWLAERRFMRGVRAAFRVVTSWFGGSLAFVLWVIAASIGAVLAMVSHFEQGTAVGLWLIVALVIATVFAIVRKRTRVAALAVAHLLAFVMWTVVDRSTSTALDYYRLWGGSSRRLGDAKTAEAAYRRATEIAPDDGNAYYQLGKILLSREAGDEGIAMLHRAQDLEPLKARAYVAEARWLAAHGHPDEALAKAREATIVDPDDKEARSLLQSLGG
jgi:hypothetical protein